MPPPPRMPMRTGEGTVVVMGSPLEGASWSQEVRWCPCGVGSDGRGVRGDHQGGQGLGPFEVLGRLLTGADRVDPLREGVLPVTGDVERDGTLAGVHAGAAVGAESVRK